VLERLSPRCISLTTETASVTLIDANSVTSCESNAPTCNQIPNTGTVGEKLVRVGRPVSCNQLMETGTFGMNVVGHVSLFDTTLGDLEVALDWFCR
jgi:hypothetical protein